MSEGVTTASRVVTGKLHRVRRGRAQTFVTAPLAARSPVRRPARIAVMLALAHAIEDAIQRGVVRDRAEVARRLGLTRARVTQLLDLTLLAPDIQAELLALESVNGVEPICEFRLRAVAHAGRWNHQRERWVAITTEEHSRKPMASVTV